MSGPGCGRNYICVGNPGNGKSTLLNGMMGEVKFQSGVSFGAGMTYQFDKHEKDGCWYFDTPGLSDMEMREKAGKAIEEALKQGGEYTILFVMFLQSGRILPQDVQTLKIILQACPRIANNYGILINKSLDMDVMKANMEKIMVSLYAGFEEAGLSRTAFVHCWPEDDSVKNKNNVLPSLPDHVLEFIQGVPTIEIEPSDVGSLDLKNYDEEVDRLNSVVDRLLADSQRMTLMMQEQQKEFHAQLLALQQRAEERAERAEERAERQQERQMTMMQRTLERQAAASAASHTQPEDAGFGTKLVRGIPLIGGFF